MHAAVVAAAGAPAISLAVQCIKWPQLTQSQTVLGAGTSSPMPAAVRPPTAARLLLGNLPPHTIVSEGSARLGN
jgi:hypothetical protein